MKSGKDYACINGELTWTINLKSFEIIAECVEFNEETKWTINLKSFEMKLELF